MQLTREGMDAPFDMRRCERCNEYESKGPLQLSLQLRALQMQQLEVELSQLREFGSSGARVPEVSQQKLQQLRVQLADAETRAASHFVILQQHQQRKESQERKAAASQVSPCLQ